jgi:branched-chain amino acid transport system ATP-binding protein
MTGPVLEAVNLSKRFGALQATDNVSFEIRAGARLALIGPNGAGKTTLINLLSGLIKPQSGTIRLLGRDITRASSEQRVKHGLVRTFQINNLFRSMTVTENIYLAASEHLGSSHRFFRSAGKSSEVLDHIEKTLTQCGIVEFRDRYLSDLSYGCQRLVEIAMALCLEPKVLLLDEPAAGIPDDEIPRLLEILDSLPPQLAIVLIEHDMQVVRRFASEVIVLVAGARLTAGKPQDVMTNPEVRRAYLGQSGQARYDGAEAHA